MTDYEWLDEMKLCHKCRREKVAPNKKFCFECLEKIREENARRYNPEYARLYQDRRRELYQEKKAKGICVRCSRPATHGMHCYECSIKMKRRSQYKAEQRKRQRHERGLIPEQRKINGKCIRCEEPVVAGIQYCEKHRQMCSEAGKKGYKQNLINKNNPWINGWENAKRQNRSVQGISDRK